MPKKAPYLWDYDIDEERFKKILWGENRIGHLDQTWATIRLFESAPYWDIVRLLGYPEIVRRWPLLRNRIRSQSRRRGFDFLVDWLRTKHPEKIAHG